MKYKVKLIFIVFIIMTVNTFSSVKEKCPMILGKYFVVYNNKVFSVEDKIGMYRYDEWTEKNIRKLSEIEEKDILKVNGKYLITKEKVYYLNMEIENVDVDSFEVLFENISKDKNHIYYEHKIMFENTSIEDFKILDKHHFIYGEDIVYLSENDLYKEKGITNFERPESIWNVNIQTYKIIDRVYSKDKNKVYYKNKEIEGADPKTFKKITSVYSKDKNNVYYENFILENIDPKTFKVLENGYSKDKENIYWKHKKVIEHNNRKFKLLDYGLLEIEGNLYINWHKSDKVDVKTLKKIGEYIWLDKNDIYYINEERPVAGTRLKERIENFDFRKFKNLRDNYYIYNNLYIYYNDIMISKDVKNFKFLSKNYTMDGENIYFKGEKIYDVDIQTFEIISEKYAKDKNNVYHRNSKVKNVNVKKFRKIYCGLVVDDSMIYDIDN